MLLVLLCMSLIVLAESDPNPEAHARFRHYFDKHSYDRHDRYDRRGDGWVYFPHHSSDYGGNKKVGGSLVGSIGLTGLGGGLGSIGGGLGPIGSGLSLLGGGLSPLGGGFGPHGGRLSVIGGGLGGWNLGHKGIGLHGLSGIGGLGGIGGLYGGLGSGAFGGNLGLRVGLNW